MKCPYCSGMSTVRDVGGSRAYTDDLRQVNRTRKCRLGHTWPTSEIDAAELADLRRRAHLFEMTKGSA